jgi:hypothetical protein
VAAAFSERHAMSVHDRICVGGSPLLKTRNREANSFADVQCDEDERVDPEDRQVIFGLKAHSHTGGNVVGGIIGASEFAIVVSVHGNAVVKYDRSTCSD